uniref:Small ribosomal subunit protein uS17c n=1 Tax=Porphyridium sordidum TaxID=28024 RepID=A0A1C9CE59_PORSO|nr:ribosomal protein S17 [Porphyridium sordidum]AOM66657.1 ribosomal protein S17 [Porphyridium sordidum]
MPTKVMLGKVVSDKMDKSRVILVETKIAHPKYKKITKMSKKYYAHDEENTSHIGDVVTIEETRPLSRHKRWKIINIQSQKL